ncbi:MAG: hypothetical protein HKO65_15295 [Gemmatimonadetes bacterium]|nr:hypothetical protein [Gemmatimonadota bacterium]NNM06457.1 hypothetical protein [Gemmatimonadota bacterium]
MANFGSRRGFADKLTLPLMILAFLAVVGFLFWLNVTAEPTQIVIEEAAERSTTASAILAVSDFLADAGQYEGQVVEVTDARVASRLGTQAFWIGPDDRPFLVKMDPDLVAAGTEVLIEQTVTLVGSVWNMTDSTHAAWDGQGAFPNEGDKIVAEFAIGSPFLEVTEIVTPEAAGGDAGSGGSS